MIAVAAIVVALLLSLPGAPAIDVHAVRVATLSKLDAPVCALHDPDQDVYFVSNINGAGTARDNNGYISRVSPDGRLTTRRFVEGGRAGATLNAPKGLAIVGRELFVADIDVVRSFDRVTGKPLRTFQMPAPGGLFLNEMAVGPDDAVYVTDTRLEFEGDTARHLGPDRVFRIGMNGPMSIALEGDLEAPSGIGWDAATSRFLITGLQGTHIFEWRPGTAAASPIWNGIGGYDGIVFDGPTWLVSSLDGNGIFAIREGHEERIIDHLTTPAAIGFDRKRRQLLIPSFEANTLEIWRLTGRD
jgi:sugar lactone lactonase YvrE